MSDESSEESQLIYVSYCKSFKQNYILHLSLDGTLLTILALFGIYFLHISYNHIKSTTLPTDGTKIITKNPLTRNVCLCATVILLYITAMSLKVTNHLLCIFNPQLSRITANIFVYIHGIALAGTLKMFAYRLKQSFSGTEYEPSRKLYVLLMSSIILFVCVYTIAFTIGFLGVVKQIPTDTAITMIAGMATFLFFLYIFIIVAAVTLFISTLKKVKLTQKKQTIHPIFSDVNFVDCIDCNPFFVFLTF